MTSDGVNSYTWDRANRLLSMGGASYQYDGEGRRVQQTVSSTVTKYLLDIQPGLAVVLSETTGANTMRYVHSPRGIHAHKDTGGNWEWIVQDGLGSVREVVDNSVGVLESRNYGPYGDTFGGTITTSPTYEAPNFGFTGELVDGSGLLDLRTRRYMAGLGTFASLDLLETPNQYAYVDGNPITRTDPLGLQGGEAAGIAGICALCPECCVAGLIIIGWWWIINQIRTRTRTRTDDTTGSQFPCTQAGFNSLGEYGPFGYSSPNTLGQWSIFDGDALGDLRCHLRYYNGSTYDALFQALSNPPFMVGFKMRQSSGGFPSYNYNDPFNSGTGTIYVGQPAEREKGTRADRIASFVEETVHAAQFHNKIPGGKCTMSVYEAELQAISLRVQWMLSSGINPANFVYNAGWLVPPQQLAQLILETYNSFSTGQGLGDVRHLPAFPYQDPVTGLVDQTYSACPLSDGGGIIPVPFASSAGGVGNILRGLQNAPAILTAVGCIN